MKIIRAKNLKTGMYFYGRVLSGSRSIGCDAIENEDICGIITDIVEGGCTDRSITVTINDEEFQLMETDKVAIKSRSL